MKDLPKLVFTVAIAVVFVVSTFVALFGAGSMLNATLRTYVFKVEECTYKPIARPIESEGIMEEPQEECKVDYNRAKGNIADGLGMFILAAPLALVSFWTTRRTVKE
ncbi:MAG: hypothetical protein WDZ44_00320 [Candidatus Spechtbacterales bacterium]